MHSESGAAADVCQRLTVRPSLAPGNPHFSTWVRLLRTNGHHNRSSGDSNHALDFDSLQLSFFPNPNLNRFLHRLGICGGNTAGTGLKLQTLKLHATALIMAS